MASIFIRQADIADAAQIADLSRQTFYDTFAAANTKENMDLFMNEQFSREKLMSEVGDAGNIFLLAFDEDEIAGYALLREGIQYAQFDDLPAIEIVRIYALQTSIGKGVGSAMIKKSIELARELNKEIIWLGVWEHNKRAIDFYTKWGFEKFSEHEFILGTDVQTDWLMKRKV
ncbi:MAG: GNAT family N-acetyltransferase [Bacteroidota bacterium]